MPTATSAWGTFKTTPPGFAARLTTSTDPGERIFSVHCKEVTLKRLIVTAVALLALTGAGFFDGHSAQAYNADRHGTCNDLGAYRYHEDHFDRCMFDNTGYYTMGWYPVAY